MTKRPHVADGPFKAGNTRSKETAVAPRPWTKEEMDAAKPLPLPTVEAPATQAPSDGRPHIGKGEATPGGRPDDN
jgi:hypothetical protein